jgi:hypothetical protein
MRKALKQKGLLIAVELGADWPEAVPIEKNAAVRRVIAQEDGETPEAFAARLATLARRIFQPGVELGDAVVACNERTDPAASVARRSMGATLLERMAPSGTFVLTASARAGGRLRHALSALAIDLAPEASATVTVHFDGERETADRDALRVA